MLFDPVSNTEISVTYNGEVASTSQFGTSTNNIWSDHPDTYLNDWVSTLPTDSDFIALTGASELTNTLTFSAPVANLLMVIGVLAANDEMATYDFDRAGTVLSTGPGNWGTGASGSLDLMDIGDGNLSLFGLNSAGVVMFDGTFTSLTWVVPISVGFSAFNIGIAAENIAQSIPEPGTWVSAALLLGATACVVRVSRSRTSCTSPKNGSKKLAP